MPDLCCVNVGTKYSPEYVEKLYNSAKRNCTVDYDFVIITDNPVHYQHLDAKIITIEHDYWKNPKQGWWYKMYLFNPDLPIDNQVLYLDLDVVVVSNIDKFFNYKQDQMCICQDFNRVTIPKYHVSNSSVMYFDRAQYADLWTTFINNHKELTSKYRGDQDYITAHLGKNKHWWPQQWAMSWKWEVKGGGVKTNRGHGQVEYLSNKPYVLDPQTSLLVFHGNPNPHDELDFSIIKENWQ